MNRVIDLHGEGQSGQCGDARAGSPENRTVSSSEPPEERKVAGSIPALAAKFDAVQPKCSEPIDTDQGYTDLGAACLTCRSLTAPRGRPPVGPAQPRHRGRGQHHPNNDRVDEESDGHADADHSDDDVWV